MSDPHFYVSTACHHNLHSECRKRCKYCFTQCQCPCHTDHTKIHIGLSPRLIMFTVAWVILFSWGVYLGITEIF